MELKLIFGFVLIFHGVHSQDYCNKSLCKGRNHIACGHSGVSWKTKKCEKMKLWKFNEFFKKKKLQKCLYISKKTSNF
jgi:hypothetical protein